MTPTRITVLISGNGTNLQALIDACSKGSLSEAIIIRVISNRKAAYGLVRARDAGIPTHYLNFMKFKQDFPDNKQAREEYCRSLANIVLADQPDIVVCAGWMMILDPSFLDPLASSGVPCINLHPALPNAYNGTNAIGRAYDDFQKGLIKESGIQIHYVSKEVDMGEPILVEKIAMIEGESLDDFERRVHTLEWSSIVSGTRTALKRIQRETA